MLIECVPNFSEGRQRGVLDDIAAALDSVPGARVLDVDPDAGVHRTVMTVIGAPEAVLEAMFRGAREAVRLIDMRRHHGAHPRMGAADVVPFVPWSGVEMGAVVELARRFGARVGTELGLPGWFYGEAATLPARRLLHAVRRGEWEGLEAKFQRWTADFGPQQPHPSAGASAVGARGVLVAFNVNLRAEGDAVAVARRVAASLRELGEPGRPALPALRAIGWYSELHHTAQVSMNLVDWRVTPPHVAYEAVRAAAESLGATVAGSELVGMIPREPLLLAGAFYARAGEDPVQAAIRGLGLNSVKDFDPRRKTIEWALEADT